MINKGPAKLRTLPPLNIVDRVSALFIGFAIYISILDSVKIHY